MSPPEYMLDLNQDLATQRSMCRTTILAAFVIPILFGCQEHAPAEKINYQEALATIDREVPAHMLHAHELWKSQMFERLWRRPLDYREESLRVLGSPQPEPIHYLAVATMNSLPLESYVSYCDQVITIAEKRASSAKDSPAYMVMACLFPVLNKTIFHQYQREDVRSLYLRAQASKVLGREQKDMINSVLSGKLAISLPERIWSYVKTFL